MKRFINADPAGFDGGLNWYMYANNSPLMYVDPDGEIPILAIVGLAAISAAADLAYQMGVEGRSLSEVNWLRTAAWGAVGAVGGGGVSVARTLGAYGLRQAGLTGLARTQFAMGVGALTIRHSSQRAAAYVMSRPIYTSTAKNANYLFGFEAANSFRIGLFSGQGPNPGAGASFRNLLPYNPYQPDFWQGVGSMTNNAIGSIPNYSTQSRSTSGSFGNASVGIISNGSFK